MMPYPNAFLGIPQMPTSQVNGQIRILPVGDERTAPDLRRGEYAAVVPVDRFHYDSLYVLEETGVPSIYQCQHVGGGRVRISDRDPHGVAHTVEREAFQAAVVGIVIVTCRVLDVEALERALCGGGGQ